MNKLLRFLFLGLLILSFVSVIIALISKSLELCLLSSVFSGAMVGLNLAYGEVNENK